MVAGGLSSSAVVSSCLTEMVSGRALNRGELLAREEIKRGFGGDKLNLRSVWLDDLLRGRRRLG